MDKAEKLWIASVAVAKNMDYETLKYSDYMYSKEELTEEVYSYVVECKKIGIDNFYEKYKDYKLF